MIVGLVVAEIVSLAGAELCFGFVSEVSSVFVVLQEPAFEQVPVAVLPVPAAVQMAVVALEHDSEAVVEQADFVLVLSVPVVAQLAVVAQEHDSEVAAEQAEPVLALLVLAAVAVVVPVFVVVAGPCFAP